MNWDSAIQLADKLLDKGGSLGVLVVCVGMFLAYLLFKSWDDAKAERQRNESIERMGNACHTVQLETLDRVERMHERTAQALDRNTEAYERNSAALDKVLKTRNRKPRESKTFAPVPVPAAEPEPEEEQEPPA